MVLVPPRMAVGRMASYDLEEVASADFYLE